MLRILRRGRLPTTGRVEGRLLSCAVNGGCRQLVGLGGAAWGSRGEAGKAGKALRIQRPRYYSTEGAQKLEKPEDSAELAYEEQSTPAELEGPTYDFPPFCPGCGAASQQNDPEAPGFYSKIPPKRFREKIIPESRNKEDEIFKAALARVAEDTEVLQALKVVQKKGTSPDAPLPGADEFIQPEAEFDLFAEEKAWKEEQERKKMEEAELEVLEMVPDKEVPKICERCHSMLHHHTAPDLPEATKPSIARIADFIKHCGHRNNHIYHLIDAADLPLTFIPDLKREIAYHLPAVMAARLTISFVVTRADVLMPKEDQILKIRPKIKKILQELMPEGEELETLEQKFRIVSFRTGLGVGGLKREIKEGMREGGIWLVGKVNVGKSRVVTDIIPEGSFPTPLEGRKPDYTAGVVKPTISDLPGTTAAPVRISFIGDKRKPIGEIVDLPGLDRDSFADYVRPELKKKLILKDRMTGLSQTVKFGQSIVVAGLIMITPKFRNENTIFTINPFLDVPIHITATDKAIELLNHRKPAELPWPGKIAWQNPPEIPEDKPAPLLAAEDITNKLIRQLARKESPLAEVEPELLEQKPPPPHIKKAGEFPLATDVTLIRNEHLSKDEYARAPYRIYSTDIVLSGLGWIEIAAQIRRGRFNRFGQELDKPELPVVEIWSPEGKGVGTRPTLNIDRERLEAERASSKRGPRRGPARGRTKKSYPGKFSKKKN